MKIVVVVANSKQIPSIQTQDINHLGIVAGIVDEIGIVKRINALVGTHPLEKVSAGRVVKASISGQKILLVFERYLEVTDDQKRQAIAKLIF